MSHSNLSIIVAMTPDRVIGLNGKMPWYMPADLKYFRKITTGKSIMMGRKTHESIGRPLPDRHNIVITRDLSYQSEGCTVVHSIQQALELTQNEVETMIIGGGALYHSILPLTSTLYITEIEANVPGDTFFPEFDRNLFVLKQQLNFQPDIHNPYPYRFIVLSRLITDT